MSEQWELTTRRVFVRRLPDDPPTSPAPALPPAPCNEDFRLVESALAGERGDDQRRIAVEGVRWLQLLLCKNRDYGSSVWKQPILIPWTSAADAIMVRMSDKIERLRTLVGHEDAAEVADEKLSDTVADLGAYCLLWLARPKPEREIESPNGSTTTNPDEISEVL